MMSGMTYQKISNTDCAYAAGIVGGTRLLVGQ